MAKDLKLAEAVEKEDSGFRGHLDVSADALPAIKKWKVGKEYTFTVKAKMVALRDGEYGENGMRGSFEVQSASSDDGREKSKEEAAADKISARVKKGRSY